MSLKSSQPFVVNPSPNSSAPSNHRYAFHHCRLVLLVPVFHINETCLDSFSRMNDLYQWIFLFLLWLVFHYYKYWSDTTEFFFLLPDDEHSVISTFFAVMKEPSFFFSSQKANPFYAYRLERGRDWSGGWLQRHHTLGDASESPRVLWKHRCWSPPPELIQLDLGWVQNLHCSRSADAVVPGTILGELLILWGLLKKTGGWGGEWPILWCCTHHKAHLYTALITLRHT